MELADVLSGGSTTDGELPAVSRAHGTRSRARAWLLVVGVMTAAAALTAFLYSGPRRDVPPLMRLAIELPSGLRLAPEPPQISPDGRYVAVVGRQSGEEDRVWIRPLDAAASGRWPARRSRRSCSGRPTVARWRSSRRER